MNDYPHHVSGFFSRREEAESARDQLLEQGLPLERLRLFVSDEPAPAPAPKADSNAVLKKIVVDGAIGTAVGTGLGALAELALVVANVSLFVASPLIAPLAMLGWGASIGGVIGTVAGIQAKPEVEKDPGWLSKMVADAIALHQVVLVAKTLTERETLTAQQVIEAAVGDYKDIASA